MATTTPNHKRTAITERVEKVRDLSAKIKETKDSSEVAALTADLRKTAEELRELARK